MHRLLARPKLIRRLADPTKSCIARWRISQQPKAYRKEARSKYAWETDGLKETYSLS